jgi:Flp pilus assembly protein TadG
MTTTKRFGSRRGQVLVESALVLMPLLFLIFGILDSGMALWVRATIEHAAREGCRYAIT